MNCQFDDDPLTQAQAVARAGCSKWAFQKYKGQLGIDGEQPFWDRRQRLFTPEEADLIGGMVKGNGQRGPDRGPRKRR